MPEGSDWAGTGSGRTAIAELLGEHKLSVPTRSLVIAKPGQRSVDHIAVPITWDVHSAVRVTAHAPGQELSDHDAYVVSVTS